MKKLNEILCLVALFITIVSGGYFLHNEFIKYILMKYSVNQNCGCVLQK